MIPQLVQRLVATAGVTLENAMVDVLTCDPVDIIFHMEQVWYAAHPWPPTAPLGPAHARGALLALGRYAPFGPAAQPAWDHLGYSYVLENTRVVQILRRVVREYRAGEGLGIPSRETQLWIDTTEALLFGAANPMTAWLSTSAIRQDPEAVRRNAYWRLFGLDLAFGGEDNRAPVYDKATAASTGFVRLFEELLFELWQAISNVRNTSGVNASDNDRIFRITDELRDMLQTRRLSNNLAREELAAATVLGWAELTLSANTPMVIDLRADATNAADRLKLIGDRVGLPAHRQSASLFAMSSDLSLFLRTIETGVIRTPEYAWVLYLEQPPTGSLPTDPPPIGASSRRVITEWAAATGKDLKARGKPIEPPPRRQLVTAT